MCLSNSLYIEEDPDFDVEFVFILMLHNIMSSHCRLSIGYISYHSNQLILHIQIFLANLVSTWNRYFLIFVYNICNIYLNRVIEYTKFNLYRFCYKLYFKSLPHNNIENPKGYAGHLSSVAWLYNHTISFLNNSHHYYLPAYNPE